MGCSASKTQQVIASKGEPNVSETPVQKTPVTEELNNNQNNNGSITATTATATITVNDDNVIQPAGQQQQQQVDGTNAAELLEPNNKPASNDITRERSISIITDDGVGDVEENAEQALLDVEKIHEALSQFTVVEKDLMSLIITRHISYRQLLREKYNEKYDEDLIKNSRHKTTDCFQYLLTGLLYTPEEFLATLMKRYVEKKDYVKIAQILSSFNSNVISSAKLHYFQMYESSFSDDVSKSLDDKVTQTLKDTMISLSTLNRSENNPELENKTVIEEAADTLSQGPNEILYLLTRKPYSKATLSAIFEQYKLRYYLDIADSIDLEFHDEPQIVLSTIVRTAENSSKYFTTQIRDAIESQDEQRIVDVLIYRHTVDLSIIVNEYKEQFQTSLIDDVLKVCSQQYKSGLKVFFKYQVK